jgi:hypothetical protein
MRCDTPSSAASSICVNPAALRRLASRAPKLAGSSSDRQFRHVVEFDRDVWYEVHFQDFEFEEVFAGSSDVEVVHEQTGANASPESASRDQ